MKYSRVFISLILVLLLSACSFSLAADVTPPPGYQPPPQMETQPVAQTGALYPLVPPNPADGAEIFAEKCAPCHGATGMGDGPRAAQLPNPVAAIGSAEVARNSTPSNWYSIVTQGNLERFMPPFASLSDRERWDLVAYTYSLSASDTILSQGAQLYQANCARCHGEQGNGNGPDASGLSRLLLDLTSLEYSSKKSAADFFTAISEGVPPDMPAYTNLLAEEERWAISDYLRSLTFAGPGELIASGDATLVVPTALPGDIPSSSPRPDGTPEPNLEATQTISSTQGSGTVAGLVTNASGGSVPAGLTVTLHGFDEMQVVMTQTATLEADGTYAFQNVEMSAGRVFLTTVEYGGTSYGSDIATAGSETPEIDLPISIFETTTETSSLSVDRLHLFFEFLDEKTMRVIELFIMSNTGSKTIVAPEEGQPTVTFNLPVGATNLEFQDGVLGGRYQETAGGFGDTTSIRPGSSSHQVLFAFEMPYDRKLELAQPMTLPANAVVVLVPAGSIKIKGEGFQDAGTRDVQGTQYQMYNRSNLATGDELRLTVTGSPASSGATLSTGSNTNLIIGLASFGVALILAGVWLFLRNRSGDAEEDLAEETEVREELAQENTETIMDAILALDDLHKSGQLPDDAYRERRAQLKARLKELMG